MIKTTMATYDLVQQSKLCPTCGGLGRQADGSQCERCDGTGRVDVDDIEEDDTYGIKDDEE